MFFESSMSNGTHILDKFEFENGNILENVEVEYVTFGVPKFDDEGFITNAVITFLPYEDRFSFFANAKEFMAMKNIEFNLNDFYFIRISSLGMPNSCSPSTTGLKYNFPNYTMLDIVNFKRKFLKEKFKIKSILSLIGENIGGYEIFTWACEYPDEMRSIFVLNSSYKNSGYRYTITKCFDYIMESAEDYYSDTYSMTSSRMLIAVNTLILAQYLPKNVLNKMENYEIDALLDVFNDEGLFKDIYDFKLQTECLLEYEISEDKLKNIKAKSLFAGINLIFYDEDVDLIPLESLIEDSTVLIYEDPIRSNDFSAYDYAPLIRDATKFLNEQLDKE